jgi:hypothetical protein
VYFAIQSNAGGSEASVGSAWTILEHNLVDALLSANNLNDVASTSSARTNLGLAIGTNVEAWDADLDAIAALSPSNDDVIQRKSGAWTNRTIAQLVTDIRTVIDAIFAPIAKGVTNGDSHNHVGGDGAALNYSDTLAAFLNSVTVPASTTYHGCPFKIGADAATNSFPWPEGGTLSDMNIRISTTQPASGSLVVTLFVNNSATALVVTIPLSSGQGTYTDNTHTVALSAGDIVRWVFVNNATGASAALTAASMKLTKTTT